MSETWVIPAGEGNEHIVCEGDDPHKPGRIRFVVRAPHGTSDVPSHEQLAEYAARSVHAVNNNDRITAERDGMRKALERLRNEIKGSWSIGQPGIRQAIGNTNFACVQRAIEEADAALTPAVSDAARGGVE